MTNVVDDFDRVAIVSQNDFGGMHEQHQIIDLEINSRTKKEINFFIEQYLVV
jgi:hypothetical protein